MASGKALSLAVGMVLRRAFGMALGMAQGAIGKALGIAAGRAIGKALWKALGMALARSHMHGLSASTAQPGTSKPSPKRTQHKALDMARKGQQLASENLRMHWFLPHLGHIWRHLRWAEFFLSFNKRSTSAQIRKC